MYYPAKVNFLGYSTIKQMMVEYAKSLTVWDTIHPTDDGRVYQKDKLLGIHHHLTNDGALSRKV